MNEQQITNLYHKPCNDCRAIDPNGVRLTKRTYFRHQQKKANRTKRTLSIITSTAISCKGCLNDTSIECDFGDECEIIDVKTTNYSM